jgi:hypothetical protein
MNYGLVGICSVCNEEIDIVDVSTTSAEMIIKFAPMCGCNRQFAKIKAAMKRVVESDPDFKSALNVPTTKDNI